jgi:hypothetical protein
MLKPDQVVCLTHEHRVDRHLPHDVAPDVMGLFMFAGYRRRMYLLYIVDPALQRDWFLTMACQGGVCHCEAALRRVLPCLSSSRAASNKLHRNSIMVYFKLTFSFRANDVKLYSKTEDRVSSGRIYLEHSSLGGRGIDAKGLFNIH